MPLTEKGEKIHAAMVEKYGEEKGEQVFYASKNAGTISGVDAVGASSTVGGQTTGYSIETDGDTGETPGAHTWTGGTQYGTLGCDQGPIPAAAQPGMVPAQPPPVASPAPVTPSATGDRIAFSIAELAGR